MPGMSFKEGEREAGGREGGRERERESEKDVKGSQLGNLVVEIGSQGLSMQDRAV